MSIKTVPDVIRYKDIVKELPEQQAQVRKLLKKKGMNPDDFHITPFYYSHIDTNPNQELFISGRFIEHVEFVGDNRTGKARVYWYIVDTLSQRTVEYDGVRLNTKGSLGFEKPALEFAYNKVELAFTIGFIAGPNNPEFCKVGDDFIIARYDKTTKEYQYTSIQEYLNTYPEFITSMPLPILRNRELREQEKQDK